MLINYNHIYLPMPESKKETSSEQKPQKSQRVILQHTEEAALTQLERSGKGLFLSGISAGLDIGFSVLLMCIILTMFTGVVNPHVLDFFVACSYPIGFIFVILGRSELFTEHTTLAILPVLQGLAPIKKLLRLWLIVYAGNILGGIVFAGILALLAGQFHFLHPWALAKIADRLLHYGWATTLLSAALAGWLMGLLAWLIAASRDTISQIVLIFIVTAAIGIIGLPHSIVGNIEVVTGIFTGDVSIAQYFNFMVPVTLGNALGGALFVGVIKFNHTLYSGEEKDLGMEEK